MGRTQTNNTCARLHRQLWEIGCWQTLAHACFTAHFYNDDDHDNDSDKLFGWLIEWIDLYGRF